MLNRHSHFDIKETNLDGALCLSLSGQFDAQASEKFTKYILDIVFSTRFPEQFGLEKFTNMIQYGGSPRASIYLAHGAKSYAFIKRRGYVIPEDVRAICHDVLRHRIGLTYEAEAESITTDDIITDI